VDLSAVFRIFQDQSFTFTPRVYATLVFPQPVRFWEVDGGGNEIAEGMASTVTFEVGNTLQMEYPAGLRTPMTIAPTFSIRNQFTSRTTNEFREDLELTVGEFQLKLPSFELFPSVTTDACYFATVTIDVADIIPDESCPVTTPAVTSPEINIDLGPLYHTSLFGLQQSMTLFPFAADDCAPGSDGCHRWELAGFNTVPGAAIVLDPENPVIGVTTTLASALATGTGPAGTLTQSITVTNQGDVPLTAAQVLDALAIQITGGGAFGVRTIVSPQLTENALFNGVGDLGTLTRADILAVGGSGNIAINFAVAPGNIFTTTLDADGTSQIVGTTVRAHAEASFGVFAFDVRPSSTNPSTNGVLPVVVLSTPGMDAATIDPASARLEGVAPLRWELVPRGSLNDLTLKFDRQAIVAALQQRLAAGPVAVAAVQQPAPDMPDPEVVAHALLGGLSLSAAQAQAADRNGNGRVDIGDLRALIQRTPVAIDLASALGGPAAAPGGGGGGGPSGTNLTVVLTGVLRNGTPFMGENALIVKGN